jgi:hypothetical protein
MFSEGFHSLLSNDPDIVSLVDTRIYQVLVPEGTAYPCLSYQIVSGLVDIALDSTAAKERRIQFDCWAMSYPAVKELEAALANLLEGYEGVLADGTRVISSTPGIVLDDWADSSRVFRSMAEYIITFS